MTDPPLARLTACGDVEEANAAIGAAISTNSMEAEHDTLLGTVQRDLLDLAADLADPRSTRLNPAAHRRLESARQQYAPPAPAPPGSHVLAGGNEAAGLLRLARAVTRRAERSVRILAATEPERVPSSAAAYLSALAALLSAVALRVDREDPGNLAMGACGDRPPRARPA
ncbi:ATP:cob(I)alamin adenosyltransferase [Streptomyces malaysiensis subsp. malaysiensis]|uniref:ATP:cob(I)alamin adenosyltransferase n=1 Tax=Streptomyces malaysiensis TaxID=92644 RepID=UPI000BFC07F7|nr:ATP:cob(I)alamin adenosyltransferase [Streptomyces malaysiensis]ATL81559.1 ATP:cob(I)alamin adenosyltransferase [Streptomyces malaysiensis]QDL73992.1 ATP:cob(I)alamin adenosyltransferase [Streptomyces malaysiensis]